MILLGVNIDHVATLRQARYRGSHQSPLAEPSPLRAALAAEAAGAAGITAHLRADRRHIQDSDLAALRSKIRTKLNLEMGNSPEILRIALDLKPEDVCLVPEEREEITTEGGLDCVKNSGVLAPTIAALAAAGITVSLFIDPDPAQVLEAARLGAGVVELHTGAFANALEPSARDAEFQRLDDAARLAHKAGLIVNAGHGINYENISMVRNLPYLHELNIGHSIVGRAVFCGFRQAVAEMLSAMNPAS